MPYLLIIVLVPVFFALSAVGIIIFQKRGRRSRRFFGGDPGKQRSKAWQREKELALDRISDSVISLDRQWRYTFLNEAALRTNPAGKESSLGKVIWDMHPEASGTIFHQKAMEAMNTRRLVELEFFYAPLDTWFELKIYPSTDGVTVIRRDITQQKKALEEINRKERRFEALIRNSSDGLMLLDADGTVLDASPSAEKILGYPQRELVGRVRKDLVHPDDLALVRDAFLSVLRFPGAVRTISFRHILPDGTTNWMECTWKNLLKEPYLNAVVLNYRDITEAVGARTRIVAERNLSDSIINSLPGIFYLFTKGGQLLRWNQNFERLSQYPPEQIRQMKPFDFVRPTEQSSLREKIENVFSIGEDFVQLHFVPRTGEAIPHFFTGRAISYEGQPCLLGVGIDFTEKVRAQEQIRETTMQLRELAAHLQDILEEERIAIARDVHDDLGQQLTAVKIGLYRLCDLLPGDAPAEEAVRRIIDMTGAGIESIRRISTRLRPGILDDLGIVEAIKWQIEEFEERSSVPVTAEFCDSCQIADPAISTHLFRIFQETLTNISRHASATRVEVKFESDDRMIRLRVADNGKGLNAGENEKKHTLGLLGIRERIHLMGGRFTITSEPDRGTVIEIEVPAQKNGQHACAS